MTGTECKLDHLRNLAALSLLRFALALPVLMR
ncbi:hypothetical protein VCHENC02_0154B, partial [Vibrio harveyi]